MTIRESDFTQTVIDNCCKRAAYRCSNPDCRVNTIAPSDEDKNKFIYIGNVAHISAASKGGPRYNNSLTKSERRDINNSIYLCVSCATMIDKNMGLDYPIEMLNEWKQSHEKWISNYLNKNNITEVSGDHFAEGIGEITGLHIKKAVKITPGTVVKSKGIGKVTGTKIE